jgi:uncharacterized protein
MNKTISPSPIVLKECRYDGVSYISPTWEQMGEYTFHLAKEIINSNQKFDRVVALAKGGWTWARTLMDYIGVDEISSVRFKAYQEINGQSDPQIVQPLADSINGEKILLFDEVIETGATISKASDYLKMMGAKNLMTASLCYKPHSHIKPDFYAFTTSAWVIFPHEIRETIEELYGKWKVAKISEIEIIKRLDEIGMPDDQVKFFLKKIK